VVLNRPPLCRSWPQVCPRQSLRLFHPLLFAVWRFSMSELKGRVALVTGGSRGIGKAVASALARGGAAVAINYRERDNEANAVAEAIRKSGGHAAAFGRLAQRRRAAHGS
jgi:hypothetical protein